MNSNSTIECTDLGKCFRIFKDPKSRLKQALWRGRRQYYREFWALKNINFKLNQGETVGIIGSNGSGKSTLLQIICGILQPTIGSVSTKGRISALLELGSGFNPEFSGMENIFLNAAILGLTDEQVRNELDKILSFADIGEFIHQPVKSYSSGMVVRLAFAIAININPDILIIDEALAVGDERFQRKCFGQIETIRDSGASVIFVSHSASTIIDLCDRAILINSGELIADGKPKGIVTSYQKLLYAPSNKKAAIIQEISENSFDSIKQEEIISPKNGEEETQNQPEASKQPDFFDPYLLPTSTIKYEEIGASIVNAKILNSRGEQANKLQRGHKYTYQFIAKFTEDKKDIIYGMLIKTINGVELGGSTTCNISKRSGINAKAEEEYLIEFEFDCLVNPGTYFINAGIMGIHNDELTYLSRISDAAIFQVMPISNDSSTGTIDFGIKSKISRHTLRISS